MEKEFLAQVDNKAEKIRMYCENQGLDFTMHYEDARMNDFARETRPVLLQLLKDIRGGSINSVIIYKLNHLSRCVHEINEVLEVITEHNVQLVSLFEQIDTSASMGDAIIGLSRVFADYEKEMDDETNGIHIHRGGKQND